jgi:hypothetical protein
VRDLHLSACHYAEDLVGLPIEDEPESAVPGLADDDADTEVGT